MRLVTRFAALSVFLFAAACGGDDGGGDITLTPDADTTPSPDAPQQVTCTADSSYGTVTPAQQFGQADAATNPTQLVWGATLNADTMPDIVQLELYKGLGAFTNTEIVPGNYPLTGEELNYETCGVCVIFYTDADLNGTAFADNYFVTGGTVNITSVSPNITGTLTNLTLEHVTIDEANNYHSTPVGDGCNSAITSLAFDATVQTQ